MARTVRDANLETRTARGRLKPRAWPYFRSLDPGLHLGYRKGSTGACWVVRLYSGGSYLTRALDGIPDDAQDPDNVAVFSFAQAQERARQLFVASRRGSEPRGPLTVREACAAYVEFLRAERKTGDEAEGRLAKHVLPRIGDRLVAELTTAHIEAIKRAMVRVDPEDPEVERRSKDTGNRLMTSLRAALNRAFADPANAIPSDAAWRRVKPFRAVGRAREVHLDPAQSMRLINATTGAFRNLVTAALLTGARPPHELAGCRVRDFDAGAGTLRVVDGKTGPRVIVLTSSAIDFFHGLTAGRDPDALLLPRDDGEPWGKNHHIRPMQDAVKRAKLPAATTIYALRHTFASQSILAGLNLKLLAETMGTSVRMLEVHYGKFLASSRRQLIEESAFRLDVKSANVRAIR